jgi:hypothetical protein
MSIISSALSNRRASQSYALLLSNNKERLIELLSLLLKEESKGGES